MCGFAYTWIRNRLVASSHHRVGRVQSLFSSRRNWDSPIPSPAGECVPPPPPPRFRGWGHTRLRARGGGGVPIPTRGHTLQYYICIGSLWFTLFQKQRLYLTDFLYYVVGRLISLENVHSVMLQYCWYRVCTTLQFICLLSLGKAARFVSLHPVSIVTHRKANTATRED